MSTNRRRHEEHEEHESGHERWLVTYADMVTLLMVLFIVLFAMSQVDERKYYELKGGLADGFGAPAAALQGDPSVLDQPGAGAVAPVAPDVKFGDLPNVELAAVSSAVDDQLAKDEKKKYADAQAEVARLEALYRRLAAALRAHGLQDDVQASFDERGLVLSLVSRHVVFSANLAELSPRGQEVVDTIAPVLNDVDDPLQIDGHTNQAAGRPKYFDTDWDLSAARAVTVLRRFNEVWSLPTDRLSLAAFGHTKPLVEPSRPGSQMINKRVDVVVLSSLPPEARALLAEVAAQHETSAGEEP